MPSIPSTHPDVRSTASCPRTDVVNLTHCTLISQISDDQIIGVLCDLFAGRSRLALGETLEWWAETIQCDLGPKAASGVALVALSKWPFDQCAGATGVKALQDELLKRARMLIERSLRDSGEVVL
jgi:hypothetical protein